MKHAVLILAHNNLRVVRTAMELMDDERFSFYLHIDEKSKYKVEEYIPKLHKSNVIIMDSFPVYWAGYSIIKAELEMIKKAIEDKQEYLHFLQGADLPLKTVDEIDDYFNLNKNKIHIKVGEDADSFANYKVYCKHYFVENGYFRKNKLMKYVNHVIAHLYKPFVKKKAEKEPLYAGSALWSIPSDFAEYVLLNEKEINCKYKWSLAADEVFIHSILMNSEFKNRLSDNGNVRMIDWKNREGNSPKTFTMNDIEEIKKSIDAPNIIFARKFSEDRDIEIVNFIKNELSNKRVEI